MNNLTPGQVKEGDTLYGEKIHPYMKNDFYGTQEIRETFARISKRHSVLSY